MATRKAITASGPYKVSESAWYYIDEGGLSYIQEERTDTVLIHANQVHIPWRVLKAIMRKVPS